MKKILFYLLVINISGIFSISVRAQGTVSTGRESVRASVDFIDIVNYDLAHPSVPHTAELENEDDFEIPAKPHADPATVRYRVPTFTTYTPTTLLPVSPSPTDSFEATLDNGTSIPPDTHGAVDSNYCITAINTSVHIQTRAGVNVSSVSLDSWWSSLVSGGTYDPRVHYDPNYHRWILVTDVDGQLASSALLIAVSKTSNPTGGWWMFKVPIASSGYWLDYPNVGFNKKWVVVTGNLFAVPPASGYGGCKVFAFDYASLMAGTGAPFTAFTQSSSSCITPTITYDATLNNIFCVESWDGSAGGGGQLNLWKISGNVGSETMTHVSYPSSSGVNWQSQGPSSGADFAPQVSTSGLIQTNDDRIFSAEYINNKIWTTHTAFFPGSGTVTRASVMWWQLDTFGTPSQIGLIDDATNANFFAFPSIAANSSNDALIGFTQFSASTHPDAAYALHMHTDPVDSTRPYFVYRHGQNTYFKNFGGSRDRWGDYSNTMIDPVNLNDFWTIQETTASTTNKWDTWWAYINMCNIVATITPAGPTTFCAGGSVTLNATTGTGYTYQWKNGGTDISGATNASYVASTSGAYTVVITSGCSATSTATTVSVNPLPASITGSLGVCVGGTSTLSDVSTPGTWTSGTGSVATIGSVSGIVSAGSPGTSLITFTQTSTGCTTTATVTVNALPTAAITAAGPTTFCSGSSVTLNASSGAGLTYQWISGGVPISGATNSSLVVSATGSYSVTVTNSAGCSATSAATSVSVNPTPSSITSSSSSFSLCSGATVTLNSTPAGGTWTSSNPSVAPVSSSGVVSGLGTGGVANISYTLSTGCYAAAVVTVNSTSAAPISGPSSVCATQTISLTDATPSGTWSSTNPAVASIGATSGVVTGLTPGTVTISYVAATGCGTGTATASVTVNPTPVVAAITGTPVVCVGGTTLLSDATPSGVWASNNTSIATAGSTSGVVSGIATGSTTIRYTVTNGFGCAATSVTTLNVFSSFTAVITPESATTFCSGGSVVLDGSTGPGYHYQWSNTGSSISGATGASYTATTSGNYTVQIINASGCTSTSSGVTVSVNPSPVVTPSVTVNASPGFEMCVTPSPITFTASPLAGAGTSPTYQWFVNGAPVGTGSTYFDPAPLTGSTVTCVMTSSDMCAFPATASESDTIGLIPSYLTPAVSMSANISPICAGDTVIFAAVPTNGGTAPTYLWTRNGVNVATGPHYHYVPLNGDTLYVTMTSSHPCVSPSTVSSYTNFRIAVQNHVTNSVVISVSQSTIASGSVDTFTAVAINGGSSPAFQWLRNGVVISGATNSRYITSTLANGDLISCMETSNASCASPVTAISSGVRVVVGGVGVQLVNNTQGNITLQPNPNRGEFTVEGTIYNNTTDGVEINITDMLGQTVYSKKVTAKNGALKENIVLGRSLANGMYMVCISSGDGRAVYRVVLDR